MSDTREFFGAPKIDFSGVKRHRTAAEIDAICDQVEADAKKIDWRAFVEHIEKHPEALIGWDMDISFDEFARRVRAGEFD